METSREMYWKVKAMSEIMLWVSMIKGTVVKSSMNEKYDEGSSEVKWNLVAMEEFW